MKFSAEMKNHAQVEPQEGVCYLGQNEGEDEFVVLSWCNIFGWMTPDGTPGVTDNVGVILPVEKH